MKMLPSKNSRIEPLKQRRALTPSPSPIGWERVVAGRVRVRFLARQAEFTLNNF